MVMDMWNSLVCYNNGLVGVHDNFQHIGEDLCFNTIHRNSVNFIAAIGSENNCFMRSGRQPCFTCRNRSIPTIHLCCQANHIRTGKSVIGKSVDAWNINLNRYSEVVDQIKETKRERTDLLAEKKELPFWNIPRKNELTARIAELTELLEELQSEKAILLDNMDCTDGKDVSKVRKKVALMEANLKELDEQEQKYSAELETALAEYAELKTQGEQFDPVELHDTRQELRPEMEQTAVQRVKEKYGDKYSHRTMDDSKRDVSRHLDEYAESQEIRQIQREREYQQRRQNKAKQERKKQDDWER